jgi:TRAP-type C4-dicarboxylate transport system permease small subunit
MKPLPYLLNIGLVFALLATIISFLVFNNTIETIGTTNEWKFYASLVGFAIFLIMFVIVIITLIVRSKTNNRS